MYAEERKKTFEWRTTNGRIAHRFGYFIFHFTIIYTIKTFKNTFVMMMQTTQETPYFSISFAESWMMNVVVRREKKNGKGKKKEDRPRFKSSWFNVIFITCRNIEIYFVNENDTAPTNDKRKMTSQIIIITVRLLLVLLIAIRSEKRWWFSSTLKMIKGRSDWCADSCDKNATIVAHHECVIASSLNDKPWCVTISVY